jgi:hypothetical protein
VGQVVIYERKNGVWVETATVMDSNGQAYDYLGHTVALNPSGTVLLTGAYGDDDKAAAAGSVHKFVKTDAGWIQEETLFASDGEHGARPFAGFSAPRADLRSCLCDFCACSDILAADGLRARRGRRLLCHWLVHQV